MAFRFVALLALAASVSAGLIPSGQVAYSSPILKAAPVAYSAPAAYAYPQQVTYQQPAAYHAVKAQRVEEYDPHPQYKFGYDVQDSLSGDSKSQSESRDGDVVQGQYSLIDADGYKRTVQYTADSVHGFNAVVSREPLGVAVKAIAAPAVVAKTAYVAAPVVSGYKGYASYADGPVVKGAYAATPVVKATPVAYPISESH